MSNKPNNQIVLNEQSIREINAYLGDIPFKYALPLVEYIGKLGQEQGFSPEQQLPEEEK